MIAIEDAQLLFTPVARAVGADSLQDGLRRYACHPSHGELLELWDDALTAVLEHLGVEAAPA